MGWIIDTGTMSAFLDGERLRLTTGEFTLLALFARRPREPISRADIAAELSPGGGFRMRDVSVNLVVLRLRRAVPNGERWFLAVRHRGYLFAANDIRI